MAKGTQIGDSFFTDEQINDINYQDKIREAVVGGGKITNDLGGGKFQEQSNGFNQVDEEEGLPQFRPMDLNAQLVAAQKANKLAGLKGAYNSSLSNLNQLDAKIDPQAYKDRGTTSTASQLGAKNFAEYLANRGQSSSGFGNQSELNRNMQLQGDIGSINLQARNAHNDIATNRTNLSNAYETDKQSANAGIEADSLARQIQLMQQEQQRQDQLNQFNLNYGLNQQQFQYGQQQDLINQTGQLGNGQYTQSGQMNQLNIQQQQAQLAEMQNPNSTTNQMARIGLDTAKLNYAALPEQLKTQAQLIAQQLSKGAIDIKTAQTQLDYLPRQMQAELNATNRSNQNSSSSASTKASQTSALADATKTLLSQMAVGQGSQWLQTYQDDLIDALGVPGYNSLVKNTYNKSVDDQGLMKANKALRNYGE